MRNINHFKYFFFFSNTYTHKCQKNEMEITTTYLNSYELKDRTLTFKYFIHDLL